MARLVAAAAQRDAARHQKFPYWRTWSAVAAVLRARRVLSSTSTIPPLHERGAPRVLARRR